jgi:glycosyltransferase involved in cell wall biosynthesis
MPWNRQYTVQEVQELADHIDFFVSSPSGLEALCLHHYGIQPEQTIAVAHSREDIDYFMNLPQDFRFRIARLGAVSDWVKNDWTSRIQAEELQLNIDPQLGRKISLCTLGIDYWNFHSPIAQSLESVGYAGAYKVAHNDHIKRAGLVDQICEKSGLPLKVAIQYHNLFSTMQGFYPSTGAVIVSSTHEGAGLPVLEAAAAGRLVLSTPVGHWERVGPVGAVELPLDAEQLVERAVETLQFYKNNPREYRLRCTQMQEHAKQYDWSNGHLGTWIDMIK